MLSFDDILRDYRPADTNTINEGQPLSCAHCGKGLSTGLRTTYRQLYQNRLPSALATVEVCGSCAEGLEALIEKRLGINKFASGAPLGIFVLGAVAMYFARIAVIFYRADAYFNSVLIGLVVLLILACVGGALACYVSIQQQAASWALSLLGRSDHDLVRARLFRFARR